MTVARIRSIDFDSAEIANEYEQDVQENGANWVPEAEIHVNSDNRHKFIITDYVCNGRDC